MSKRSISRCNKLCLLFLLKINESMCKSRKKHKLLFLLFLVTLSLLAGTTHLFAQIEGHLDISGTVKKDRRALDGAIITAKNQSGKVQSATSSAAGKFEI